jgi:hypothetical protein
MKVVAKITGEFFVDVEKFMDDPLFSDMIRSAREDIPVTVGEEHIKAIEEVISDYILTKVDSDNFNVELIEYDN